MCETLVMVHTQRHVVKIVACPRLQPERNRIRLLVVGRFHPQPILFTISCSQTGLKIAYVQTLLSPGFPPKYIQP